MKNKIFERKELLISFIFLFNQENRSRNIQINLKCYFAGLIYEESIKNRFINHFLYPSKFKWLAINFIYILT